jgi:hypothetical protein
MSGTHEIHHLGTHAATRVCAEEMTNRCMGIVMYLVAQCMMVGLLHLSLSE